MEVEATADTAASFEQNDARSIHKCGKKLVMTKFEDKVFLLFILKYGSNSKLIFFSQ